MTDSQPLSIDHLLRGIRGTIWDIDGTLLDSMTIWHDLGAHYLRAHSVEPEANLSEILWPMTIGEGVSYLKKHYSLSDSEEEIRKGLMQIVDQFYRYEVQLKPGVQMFLEALARRGMPMVLTTIGDPDLENAALTRLGVRHFFREMYVCEAYHTTKKESRIYRIAANDMGFSPSECLVFEDILQAVRAAHKADFRTAAVEEAESLPERAEIRQTADFYIRDFTALMH